MFIPQLHIIGYRTPLVIDYTANRKNQPAGLRHMTYAEFDSLFEPLVQYAIHSAPGYRLDYNINGNGTRQGTQIANRQMIGVSGKYTTYSRIISKKFGQVKNMLANLR